MSAITFDALRYTDELIEVGVPEKQAKQQVRILQNAMNEVVQDKDLTTKKDLVDLELRLEKRFNHIDKRFIRLELLMSVMLAILVIPVLKDLLT